MFEVNGVPVKFTGVCRHEEFSPYGHALTEECWKTDIALMKADNVNAIRTATTTTRSGSWNCATRPGSTSWTKSPPAGWPPKSSDATRTWAYIFRSKETLARDKNRACVVAWSCGNESSYGINNQAEFDYAKAHDPTRLAFISQMNLRQSSQDRF